MRLIIALALSLICSSAYAQQASISITVNGQIDGTFQTITKNYNLTPQQFTSMLDLNRMDFCPKEQLPNGQLVSKLTDAQVIGCFTDYLAIGTMQRITAHEREKARGEALGR